MQTAKGKIVAACDLEILGDSYSEDGVKLDIKEDFYGGEEVDLEGVTDALERFFTANLAGNQLVEALVEAGVVQEEEIETVDGVKHVQLFRV
ncbi:MAG: DUF424 family protein [Candidatus Nanohaloarchaeota archaeon QJJ-7]|nr:DUF424 family protein [Candidatus Nanohaloarchaeota archaeon QJJ-7]